MAKHQHRLGDLVIKKGEKASNPIEIHARTGTIAVVTIYAPAELTGETMQFEVQPEKDADWCWFYHKGDAVKVASPRSAFNIPLPACHAMRVISGIPVKADRVFKVFTLLEVD